MIIVITGPTGVGKTKMSVELAKKLNGEIINADACQVFQELNIGTAKITEEEKEGIPHHLFDIKKPTENYNVFDYQLDARKILDDLLSKNITPIIVGGTGLYIKSLLYDYKFEEEEVKEYNDLTDEEIINKIKSYNISIDFDINNRRRITRVLSKLENNTYTESSQPKPLYDNVIYIGLTTDRENLYNIINNRVDVMVKNGLIEEVESFHKQNIRSQILLNAIGYKELYAYLDNIITKEESLDLIKQRSRKYAKRQYTFFKHQLPITWFDVNYENFNETIKKVLEYIEIHKK